MGLHEDFNDIRDLTTTNEIAAAILILANEIRKSSWDMDQLSHAICMGLRNGLMGIHAGDSADIREVRVHTTDEE